MGAEQDGPDGSKQAAPDGYDSWNAYWRTRRMPWRTEPEIDDQRQTFLAERLAVKPDTEKGIYPFRDEQGSIRLTRADVESLVATSTSHDVYDSDGMGWHDFADTIGSAIRRRYVASPRAALALRRETIEFARWRKQQLARGSSDVQQQGLDLRGADMKGEQLGGLPLARMRGGLNLQERAGLSPMQVELAAIHLEGAELSRADFRQAVLGNAHLERGDLFECQFEGAILYRAHLDSVDARYAHFAGANLRLASMTAGTELEGARFGQGKRRGAMLADVRWGGANLTVVDWKRVPELGDEDEARQGKQSDGTKHDASTRMAQFERAMRANRQLATAPRGQGLNEDADRFSYRAQVLQRQVWRRQGHFARAFGSGLLDLISGYGYKPIRSVVTYLLVILSFAAAYFALTNFAITPFLPSHSSPLAWYEAVVLSVSSFHGRGLFPTGLSLGDPIAILAAFEAIIGLLIEITFIATFTQRFFAR